MKLIFRIFLLAFCSFGTLYASVFSEESLELSNESGSNLSLQSDESEANESDLSLSDEADSTVHKEVDKSGAIDNDQVFCSWEDVDARDEMATKLKTELCRFSMFHDSKYEGGPNVTMFCTYKPESCKMAEIPKNARLFFLLPWVIGGVLFGNIDGARSSTKINAKGMNDEQMYCIANDWRSRDWKAKEFRTMTHCRFSQSMTMHGSIPFGAMYCTYTQSYCTELGHALDDEQVVLDIVKTIKKKDNSIRTTEEKKILKEFNKFQRSGRKVSGRGGIFGGFMEWFGNTFDKLLPFVG